MTGAKALSLALLISGVAAGCVSDRPSMDASALRGWELQASVPKVDFTLPEIGRASGRERV